MLLIKNGNVHNGLGHVEVTDLLIDDGKITKIGQNLSANCETIDASGLEVLPGFIDPTSHWGIMGSASEIRNSSDDNDEKSEVSTPEMNIKYAFNGRGITINQLPAFGITKVGVMPSDSNLFGGMGGFYEVEGVNPMKMMIKEKVAMKGSVTKDLKDTYGKRGVAPMTKMGIYALLKDEVDKANKYDESDEKCVRSEKLKALKPVLEGKMPLFISVDNPADYDFIYEIFKDYPVKLVFLKGYGVDGSYTNLIEHNTPLVCSLLANGMIDMVDKTDLAGIMKLVDQGLTVALSAGTAGWAGREDLLWTALDFVRATNEPEKVLTMLTHNAAKILGVDDFTGSLEVGKCADITLWANNPLVTFTAKLKKTIINGKVAYQEGDDFKCYL